MNKLLALLGIMIAAMVLLKFSAKSEKSVRTIYVPQQQSQHVMHYINHNPYVNHNLRPTGHYTRFNPPGKYPYYP